jgi:hypothetical protein
MEAGIVAHDDSIESGWESLLTKKVGKSSAEKRAFIQIPRTSNDVTLDDKSDERQQLIQRLSDEQFTALAGLHSSNLK